jgi:parallel beta-helix repeat protein
LTGQHATIDETGVASTVRLDGDKAAVVILSSNVKVTGFTVQNAQGDGILAAGLDGDITRITISQDSIVNNGEGVHLTGVANGTISHNIISGNSGGILLSDDAGPTDDNVLENNTISGNSADSGITVLGRNTQALTGSGQPQSSVAGVYRNSIKHNQVTGNGGAGVMLAGAAGGTAAYDNLVSANYIAGNGLAGVTVRAGRGEDLSGNEVTSNVIDTNNTVGDTDLVTTGVLVFSAGPPVTIRIGTNHVSNNAVGIWLTQPVTATDLTSNTFTSVTTPISANH